MPDGSTTGHLVLATSYSRAAYRRTTIGAAAFHCRVRNGNGWCHCAEVTRGPSRTGIIGTSHREGRRGSLMTAAKIAALQFLPRSATSATTFRKNMIFNRQSQIENRQFPLVL